MANEITVQVKMKKELKDKMVKIAEQQGFDSLAALIRFLSKKVVNREINITIQPEVEYISEDYAKYLMKREKQTLKAIKEGKAITVRSAKEFMEAMDRYESETD